MADNYLENKMEQYRSGRCAAKSVRAVRRGNMLSYSFPEYKILFVGEINDLTSRFACSLMEGGLHVAFIAGDTTDEDSAKQLRDSSGAMLLDSNCDLQELAFKWRGIDALIISGNPPAGFMDVFNTLPEIPTCLTGEKTVVIKITQTDRVLRIDTSRLNSGLNGTDGEAVVEESVDYNGMIKLLKWNLAPENRIFIGLKYKFLNFEQ